MTWEEFKTEYESKLRSPELGLADPEIRIGALRGLEKLFCQWYPDFKENPKQLLKIGRKAVTKRVVEHKGLKKISGTDNSVLYNIFLKLST